MRTSSSGKLDRLPASRRLFRPLSPFPIVLGFLIAGCTWVTVSDSLLHHLKIDEGLSHLIDTVKGVVFVLGVGVAGWLILNRYLRRLQQVSDGLLESEARYRLAMNAAKMGSFHWQMAEDRIVWSGIHEQLWGFKAGEFDGTYAAFRQRLHPEDVKPMEAEIKRCITTMTPYNQELRVVWPDGSVHWIEAWGEFSYDDSGQPLNMRGMVMEITARHQVQQELADSQTRNRLALTAARMGAWNYDFPTDTLNWSDEVFEVFGIPHQPVSFQLLLQLVLEEDRELPTLAMNKAITTRAPYQAEYRVKIGDKLYWVDDRGEVQFDAEGRPWRAFGVTLDITDRKLSEQSRLQSEANFQAMFELAAIGMAQADPHTGRLLRVNQKMTDITGYSRDELMGLRVQDVTHPADRERDWELFQKVIRREEKEYRIEKRHVRKDGGVIWVNVNMTVVRDAAGRPVRTVATIEDITQRRRAEEVIRESLLFRREAEKIARVGAWKVSPKTDYLYWTEGVYEILEVPMDYKPGLQEGLKFYDPAYVPRLQAALELALNEGVPFCIESPLVTMTGKRLWTEVRGLGRIVEEGEPYVMGTFQDITARKLVEQSLRESEERLRLTLSAAAQGLYDLNVQTGVCVVSPEYASMLGHDPATFIESLEGWMSRLHPEDKAGAVEAYQDYINGRQATYSLEFRLRTHGGGWKWVYSTGKIVAHDAKGRPLRMLGTHTDITRLKQAQRQAARDAHRTELLLELHQRGAQMTDQELYDYVLDKAIQLTDSTLGFFHQIAADQKTILLTNWNRDAIKEPHTTRTGPYPLHEGGECTDCVQERRPMIWNDYPDSRRRRGLPPVTVVSKRFMSIPVIDNGKVCIVFGVADKAENYVEDDVKQLQLVANELHKIVSQRSVQRQLSQLSRAVEQASASILITDVNGVIEYVNPQFTKTTGFTLAEARGRTPRILRSGITPPKVYEEMWQTILQGKPWRGEFLNRRKRGDLYWELTDISSLRDASGRMTHFVSIKEDITARKRLEALRQAMLNLGDHLNQTNNAQSAARALLDAADQLWKWDAATLHMFGDSRERIRSVLAVDVIAGVRREVSLAPETALSPRMSRVLKHGAELILSEAPAEPDRESEAFGDTSRLSASIMCVPVRREGRPVGVLSLQSYTIRAFTPEDLEILQALADYCGGALHRIQSEEALRGTEQRYRNLVETAFDWIWEVDAGYRYTYASPKVTDLLGFAPEEVLGRTPFELMPPEEARRVGDIFWKIHERRESFSTLENINRHKDGHLVVLESSGVPIFDGKGVFLGYRGMDRDVTERKRLEEQLRQTQKLEAIGQLAGGVAHDFNNILAAIMMQISLLQTNPDFDLDTRQSLTDVDAAARRAAALTRQLLMFSRRSVLNVKPLDLNDLVVNLLKMLGRLIGENINLRFDGASQLPPIEADAGMLDQVIMNLVVNARDAMPKGGRITITTGQHRFDEAAVLPHNSRRPGRFLSLEVADDGTGMDEDTCKRIFEPFFTTKEAGKGTGLGLATVHGIIAQHKGWIEVESEPGQGSLFRVFIPAMESAAPAQPEAAAPEAIQRGRETILLVEDDASVRRLVARVLRELGYQIYEVANGQEAMKLWQSSSAAIDLLLTDMVMPEGMTGLELAEKLRALKPGLRAIISSGYSAEIVQAGVPTKAGITYLPKPYVTKVLASAVRDCLDRQKKPESGGP
ncbi:MAG: PAS domain S-box protein [Verrucomicrobiota bacterium]